MRISRLCALFLLMVTLAACAQPRPPVGRWEGTYESGDTLIAVRVEIDKSGLIYLAAPDALNLSPDPEEHAAFRAKLAESLAFAWPQVVPRKMDFDGKVFRNPGRVAPQMLWRNGRLTVIVYPGTKPEIDIPMRAVSRFSNSPWEISAAAPT